MATPRLVYDDDCGFCKWCVRIALRHGEFEPVGFGDLSPDQRARLPAEFESCMHLLTDEAVYSCGEALERVVARFGPGWRRAMNAARRLPCWRRIRERGYRFVADRRAIWGRVRSCSDVE
ncbi:thiol-disulfide oxidoreductase DCC family protein [Halopenitus persicus]|uniref:thiol-disulfide oxidoreductase DCC family protein n=1 Tax=Halopenitus persicus TaxID=1048396 RepID=UPI000BBA49A6|nr:DCC1-like thiol-disulfide oxidoreductase family protein [Halopenitus persicus]